MNAGNENATRQGGALKTASDAPTLAPTERRVNGKPMPPVGFAFADVGDDEPARLEPITMPPVDAVPISERREYARLILGLSQWVHEPKLSLRWAVAFVALDTLTQTPKELAATSGVTAHRVRQLIAEAKKVLAVLRGEAKK